MTALLSSDPIFLILVLRPFPICPPPSPLFLFVVLFGQLYMSVISIENQNNKPTWINKSAGSLVANAVVVGDVWLVGYDIIACC